MGQDGLGTQCLFEGHYHQQSTEIEGERWKSQYQHLGFQGKETISAPFLGWSGIPEQRWLVTSKQIPKLIEENTGREDKMHRSFRNAQVQVLGGSKGESLEKKGGAPGLSKASNIQTTVRSG